MAKQITLKDLIKLVNSLTTLNIIELDESEEARDLYFGDAMAVDKNLLNRIVQDMYPYEANSIMICLKNR